MTVLGWQMGKVRGGKRKGRRKCLVVMDYVIVIVVMVSRMYICQNVSNYSFIHVKFLPALAQ